MATLLEYFNNDFARLPCVSAQSTIAVSSTVRDQTSGIEYTETAEVLVRVYSEGNSGARFWTFYFPEVNFPLEAIKNLLNHLDHFKKKNPVGYATMGFNADMNSGNLTPLESNRIFIYTEEFDPFDWGEIMKIALELDLYITLRGPNYLQTKLELDSPKAFISHDSRDKDAVARPIAAGLSSRSCRVWYDEYSLKVGDSLRESIERGIKEAKKCVLVLTPNYLSNEGWGKKEFNSVFTRELVHKQNVVLPVWYGVSSRQVYEYSPDLADRTALIWPTKRAFDDKESYNKEVELTISKLHTAIDG